MWSPKSGTTTLDTISPDAWRGFRFALRRNGHVVCLFMTLESACAKCTERAAAIPADVWDVFERN